MTGHAHTASTKQLQANGKDAVSGPAAYTTEARRGRQDEPAAATRDLHSTTSQLNVSTFCGIR
jgi:hypothetical protein